MIHGPQLHWPAGTLTKDDSAVMLTQERAGWSRSALRIVDLAAGGEVVIATGDQEYVVLPLAGSATVEVEGRTMALAGRTSVFAQVTDWAYVPTDAEVRVHSAGGGRFALPSARAARRYDPAHIDAGSVPVELRGAGQSTRQLNNFMAPEVFDQADRLMCVESLTPDGNWSSYPPHRHDDSPECTADNEEIYYFRVGRTGGTEPDRDGFALHRTYTDDGSIDQNVVVHDGDVFTIPRGYHGPCMAAPGYPLYYLNVLAGAGEGRSMAFCDDPAHHWVRDTWAGQDPDPRCPMTSALGPVIH